MNAHSVVRSPITSLALGAALAGLTGVALASPSAAPDIARVEAIYEQAQQAGAPAAAPVEMQSAQRNLDEARERARKGDNDQAARLAARAEADAQLALAKANEQTAQKSARQVEDGLVTLRAQLDQNVSQSASNSSSTMNSQSP